MGLFDIYRLVQRLITGSADDFNSDSVSKPSSLLPRLTEVFFRTWDLGFTAFGGPPVHFQILYKRFVEDEQRNSQNPPTLSTNQNRHDYRRKHQPWISQQVYEELFGICQALPGPGSTKMLFCIVLRHAGVLPAILAFFLWSLPGGLGMFVLSLGVGRISSTLPGIAYAVLSGLNASTVGIVIVAAVQLAERAVKGQGGKDEKVLNRILIIGSGCAGLCYTSLWYFPLLVGIGGVVTVFWDLWLSQAVRKANVRLDKKRRQRQTPRVPDAATRQSQSSNAIELTAQSSLKRDQVVQEAVQRRTNILTTAVVRNDQQPENQENSADSITGQEISNNSEARRRDLDTTQYPVSVVVGAFLIVGFFVFLTTLLVLRGRLSSPIPRQLSLFANMCLAGTIIFGGGPVVIPLLREYVVQPGWVNSRDFLIGLAIIQAFPGPNFNFTVYLGALSIYSLANTEYHSAGGAIFGAVIGFVGIFAPGLILAVGFQAFWNRMRSFRWVVSGLRGINATAVGLVFTAVYRLWQIGYLKANQDRSDPGADGTVGVPLAEEPWWLVVTVLTYSLNRTFGVPAAIAILIGGVLGAGWYGVTQ